MKSVHSLLAQVNVLRDSDIEKLMSIGDSRQYATGASVIAAGQTLDSIYLCLNGEYTEILPANGQSEILTTLKAGDLFGEAALLDQRPAAMTIQATAPSEVLLIPRQQIIQCLTQDQDFAGAFYYFMAVKLSQQLRHLSNLMAKRQIKEGEPLRKVLMVFATLNDSDIAWMIANGTAEKAAPESGLIQQGQSVPAVYLLLDGTLGVYISTGEKEVEVAKRVKGDILGEMSFVDGGNASATVRTLENAWILSIPQPLLAVKMQDDRGFASRFYRAIAQILFTRCQDLLVRGGGVNLATEDLNFLSDDIEVEDEIDLDVLEGTAIAATRFDWLIHQLRR